MKNAFVPQDDLEAEIESGKFESAPVHPGAVPFLAAHEQANAERIAKLRKYKRTGRDPSSKRNRQILVMCMACSWKCRASRSALALGVPACPVPDCRSFNKQMEIAE